MSGAVLIVDDDAGVRTMIERVLEDEGYEVALATDGLDALEQLDAQRPGLVLLDLQMPRMDGWALVGEMERRGLRPTIPVVVLTAAGRAQQEATKLGAEGFLAKPFDIMRLLDEVARLVQ